ncbi:MAG: 50S ribosomal protein L36, partial [Erysipelotrichaceae bacterium]
MKVRPSVKPMCDK